MTMTTLDNWFQERLNALTHLSAVTVQGEITGINGILLESRFPQARIGDLCRISRTQETEVMAEVVGFNPTHTLLSALGPLDGIAQGARVTPLFQPHNIMVSEQLPGSVLDGFGRAIDEHSLSAFALASENDHTYPTRSPVKAGWRVIKVRTGSGRISPGTHAVTLTNFARQLHH